MTVRLRELLLGSFPELRYEPTPKRIRATVGDTTVVDSDRAILVWEPRWVVPYYAVPAEDVRADLLLPAGGGAPDTGLELVRLAHQGVDGGASIVRPGPGAFTSHTAPGTELSLHFTGGERERAGYRLDDPALTGYVGLDFDAFDAWWEEDEQVVAHPRDPFHRIDVRRSSRRVRVELDGLVLADTCQPRLLFETHLPTRFYLPLEDVDLGQLRPSLTRTWCAYKGEASYWARDPGSADSGSAGPGTEPVDLAWSYPKPLPEAAEIAGMIAFFDERVDIEVDGEPQERPVTPWSPPAAPPSPN
ncbi:MAG TPA: DUF427 domain-containing protein [Micromonosporaceae bacterium]|nr:DUF427 domain-containing protein [Micromonosporaceae bacterium]